MLARSCISDRHSRDSFNQLRSTNQPHPRPLHRLLPLLHSLHLSILLIQLILHIHTVDAFTIPQHHQTIPKRLSTGTGAAAVGSGEPGRCVASTLSPEDFCSSVVNYPIASTLLAGAKHLLSPRHDLSHAQIIAENQLSVLSKKAESDFDVFMDHHLQSSKAHTNIRTKMEESSLFDSDEHPKCERVLQKYVCQLQFPRCFDDPNFLLEEAPNTPIQLHVCYSLCHDVRRTCGLEHRLNCHQHHLQLNHKWVPPTEHELRFDPKYQTQDPDFNFWFIDCIDSPPNRWKHMALYLIYGGPGTYAIYFLISLILFWAIAKLTSLNREPPTLTVAKLRQERHARRVAFEVKMKKQQAKYIKLQEIKTVMLDQQQLDTESIQAGQQITSPTSIQAASSPTSPSPIPLSSSELAALQTAVSDRATKFAQLDEMLHLLEDEIQVDFLEMKQTLADEQVENEALGFVGPDGDQLMGEAEAELAETQSLLSQSPDEEPIPDVSRSRRRHRTDLPQSSSPVPTTSCMD